MPHRPEFAIALALIAASAWPAHAHAQAQSAVERCLLDAIARAAATTPVESIRSQCASGPAPTRVPANEADEADEKPAPGVPAAAAQEEPARIDPADARSPIARRLASERAVGRNRFALLPHRPNYIDPVSHAFEAPATASPDAHVQRNEIKFQLSFKLALTPPLFDERATVFFAYTGQSWWQAYNDERSSPFREYSHEPEVFVSWAPQRHLFGWDWRLASGGFVHQSNGRSGPASRSWNRLFVDLRFDRPSGWWVGVRPWWRIPESRKPFPGSPEGDDNPQVERFLGDGEVQVGYVGDVHQFTAKLRRGFSSSGKGALQLDWSRPTGFSPGLRWHVQYFDGYGESMLDYQTRVRRLGVGVMLNDWY